MSRFSKQARTTLVLSMTAGLVLIFGVVYIFDLPADTLGGALLRLLFGVAVLMGLAFLAAFFWTVLKKRFHK